MIVVTLQKVMMMVNEERRRVPKSDNVEKRACRKVERSNAIGCIVLHAFSPYGTSFWTVQNSWCPAFFFFLRSHYSFARGLIQRSARTQASESSIGVQLFVIIIGVMCIRHFCILPFVCCAAAIALAT